MRSAVTGFRRRNGRQASVNFPPGRSSSPKTQLSGFELHEPCRWVGCGSTHTEFPSSVPPRSFAASLLGSKRLYIWMPDLEHVDVTIRDPGQSEERDFLRGTSPLT